MSPTTTRRDLLRLATSATAYAAGAAIVGGGIALAGEAKGAMGISPGLARRIAEHEAADDRLNRFYASTFNPAVDRHYAMRAAIPHVEMSGGLSMTGLPITYTTADRMSVANAKGIASIDPRAQSTDPRWRERLSHARRFYAAHLRRERAIARTGKDSGADAALAREAELWVPIRAAYQAVVAFPVASIADLSAKLAWIERDGGMEDDDLFPMVKADVARLGNGMLEAKTRRLAGEA